MSGTLSAYAEAALLQVLVGKTAFSTPTVYIALCTTLPTVASTGSTIVEPSGNGYTRVSTVAGNWNTATGSNPATMSNSATITFPTCTTATWGAIVGFALVDAATNGNVLAWGSLTSKTINVGDTASFAGGSPGDLQITLQ